MGSDSTGAGPIGTPAPRGSLAVGPTDSGARPRDGAVATSAGVPGPAERRRRFLRNAATVVIGAMIIAAALWVIYGIGIDTIVGKIQNLPTALVVTLVFLIPALEASAFVGVVFPGEVAVLVGGVAASNGKVPLAAVIVAACVGAVLGDQLGYIVGREWGVQILSRLPDRLLDAERLDRTQQFVRRAGAKGVVIGRWTAALRAFIPGLAGMSRMHYLRFLIANVIGGVGWATACVMLGYVAGAHFHTVEKATSNVSSVLLGVIVVGLIARHLVQRRRGSSSEASALERRLEGGEDAEAAAGAAVPVTGNPSEPSTRNPAAHD
ncbi:MAG: DedA family protein [Frankia sp.]